MALELTLTTPPDVSRSRDVLSRLVGVAHTRGLVDLADALVAMNDFVADDLSAIEAELEQTPVREDLVGQAAQHLLDLKGKRLRPLCVALASRLGSGFSPAALKLAAAAELVHSATLLHDDVVDGGDVRRGRPTARVLYSNAASVFAGDLLLIRALALVQAAGVEGVLDRLLQIIDEMIEAESVQLEQRGTLRPERERYFQIIEGKTASLFRWAMEAGGRAGGLEPEACEALAHFGNDLGMAFQVVDDALDLVGAAESTGKALFTDLGEGKLTYPLLVGLERDPSLVEPLAEVVREGAALSEELGLRVLTSLREHGAIEAAFELAEEYAAKARNHLECIPRSEARHGLELVAEVAVHRRG